MRFFNINNKIFQNNISGFYAVLFILIISLSSCSKAVVRTKRILGQKLDIKVTVSENVNQNSAIAFSVLQVYDEKLMDQLKNLSAKSWFEERERLRNDYPKEKKSYQSWDWEWAPGQWVGVIELPLKPSAIGGIIFANYSTKGNHRVVFDPHKSINVQLLEKNYTVSRD